MDGGHIYYCQSVLLLMLARRRNTEKQILYATLIVIQRQETVTVYTERDVRREVEAAKTGLEHGSDWQKWVSAMRRLAGVALGGGGSEFPALLVGLVRASVHEMVGHKVSGREKSLSASLLLCHESGVVVSSRICVVVAAAAFVGDGEYLNFLAMSYSILLCLRARVAQRCVSLGPGRSRVTQKRGAKIQQHLVRWCYLQ